MGSGAQARRLRPRSLERALQIPVVQSPEWLEIDTIDAVPD